MKGSERERKRGRGDEQRGRVAERRKSDGRVPAPPELINRPHSHNGEQRCASITLVTAPGKVAGGLGTSGEGSGQASNPCLPGNQRGGRHHCHGDNCRELTGGGPAGSRLTSRGLCCATRTASPAAARSQASKTRNTTLAEDEAPREAE